MAEIAFAGNMTRDPELKFVPSGRSVTRFSVAENRRWQQDGEWKESVSFWECQAWGELGENVAQSLSKGSRVIVKGRIEQRNYEVDGPDGEPVKRTVTEVTATHVGAELSYATVEITKIERKTEEGAGTAAVKREQKKDTARQRYEDEEPF